MGGTPVIIHFNTFFFINHPAIGVPPFIETLKNTLTYNIFARNMWNEGRQDRPSMSKYDQNMIKHAQNSFSAHIVANSCKFSNPGVTMVPLWCQEKLRKGWCHHQDKHCRGRSCARGWIGSWCSAESGLGLGSYLLLDHIYCSAAIQGIFGLWPLHLISEATSTVGSVRARLLGYFASYATWMHGPWGPGQNNSESFQ